MIKYGFLAEPNKTNRTASCYETVGPLEKLILVTLSSVEAESNGVFFKKYILIVAASKFFFFCYGISLLQCQDVVYRL